MQDRCGNSAHTIHNPRSNGFGSWEIGEETRMDKAVKQGSKNNCKGSRLNIQD